MQNLIRPLLIALALVLAPAPLLAQKDTLRPAVGKPLQDAQKLIQGKDYKAALPKIAEAEAVGGLTPYETFVIAQMRGAAAAGAGDSALAAQSFETVLNAKRLPPEEQLKIAEAVAGTYLRAKNYPKAIQWIQFYKDSGGTKPETLNFLPQAYYLAGDFKKAAQESANLIANAEKAGGRPSEDQLKLYASSLTKQNDMVGYTQALEKLVRFYPKPEYWADVIQRIATKPGFNRALDLDMLRLLRATGTLKDAKDYMEMAQLSVQQGLPGEAKAIVDEGFQKKILGTGQPSDLERQNRLKALVEKKVADDKKVIASTDAQVAKAPSGDPLVKTGLAYVTYGDAAKGLPMIEQGIQKGQLKNAEHAKLHLGYAYVLAGQKDKAIKTLKTVQSKDGAQDFARLWMLIAARS
jgi:outer membrane protein assembly factor BamD (BamD/ComL family)